MEIDESWQQMVTLRDGTEVTLALITPDDAPLIARGFNELSDDTKYRRFLAAKRSLSNRELTYLSDVDQIDHVAIGATRERPVPEDRDVDSGAETREGIGVARFIRLPVDEKNTDEPAAWKGGELKASGDAESTTSEVAEAAITVVDAYQNRGLGTHLLVWLLKAARERGIETFRCTLLSRNEPVRHLLDHADDIRVVERDGAVVTVEADITRAGASEASEELLKLVGRGEAELPGDSHG